MKKHEYSFIDICCWVQAHSSDLESNANFIHEITNLNTKYVKSKFTFTMSYIGKLSSWLFLALDLLKKTSL